MTQCEQIVGEVAEASGMQIAIESDRVAEIAVDGTIVMVRPTDAVETSVTFFDVIVDEGVDEAQMRKALEMSLFGRETDGGTIGLFLDSLIYSTCHSLDGVSAQEFAERLVQFAHSAQRIKDALLPQQLHILAKGVLSPFENAIQNGVPPAALSAVVQG